MQFIESNGLNWEVLSQREQSAALSLLTTAVFEEDGRPTLKGKTIHFAMTVEEAVCRVGLPSK